MHPKTVEKMDDVSKKWRKSVKDDKTIGNAVAAKEMGQVDEILVFAPKKVQRQCPGLNFFYRGSNLSIKGFFVLCST